MYDTVQYAIPAVILPPVSGKVLARMIMEERQWDDAWSMSFQPCNKAGMEEVYELLATSRRIEEEWSKCTEVPRSQANVPPLGPT
jgi:hypothetical protein